MSDWSHIPAFTTTKCFRMYANTQAISIIMISQCSARVLPDGIQIFCAHYQKPHFPQMEGDNSNDSECYSVQ